MSVSQALSPYAQVRRHDLAVVAQPPARSFEDDGTVVDDVDPVGELQRHLGVLLDEQHADALALQLADGVHHRVHDHRGEALRGLVEEQELRAGHEGAGDGEHFLLAAGKQPAFALQALAQAGEALEHGVHLPARAFALRDREVLARSQVGEDAARLRDEGDAHPRDPVGVEAGDVPALVADLARARGREPGDRAQGGRLSRAVAAEERHDLAFGQVERQAVKNMAEAVEGIDVPYLEDHAATPPRYARRTSGSRWISPGVPSAIRPPKCMTEMRSETLMMMSILCSISTMV